MRRITVASPHSYSPVAPALPLPGARSAASDAVREPDFPADGDAARVGVPTQALEMHCRRDISAEPVVLRGQRRWHLKDPLTLRYWQFGDEELFLWRQLDGSLTLAEWQARFQRRFAPRRIERAHLLGFLGMLHREGLVVADAPGQARILLERQAEQRQREQLGRLANLFAIRIRGIDPERWLAQAYPWLSWMFHPLFLGGCGLLVVSAALLVLVEWDAFRARWPDAGAFLSAGNLLWLAAALALTKVLHESGHAFTCKHFGGECHELGVMLLLFTPCLYCNVSDAWLLGDKWRRMAVSAAGIGVELVLAAGATWLWWLTVPGPFQSLCLSVMVVCSVGTVLLNGNPLLRYDGYFLLSDWLEIPNLRTEADARLQKWLVRTCLGMPCESRVGDEPTGMTRGLMLYAVLSVGYRWLVVGLIAWLAHRALVEWRLESLSYGCFALLIIGMAAPGLQRAWRGWRCPDRPRLGMLRTATVACLVVAAVSLLLLLPWPHAIEAPATLHPAESQAVYVSVPGTLLAGTRPGTAVRRGDPLATLGNNRLEIDILRLNADAATLRVQQSALRRQQAQDALRGVRGTSGQLAALEQSLLDVERQLRLLEDERDQLIVRSPRDGVLIAPPIRPADDAGDSLAGWENHPLAAENIGCFLDTGVLIGWVGDTRRREAQAFVAHAEIGHIQVGQPARIRLDELPGTILWGDVVAIGEVDSIAPPPELIARRRLAAAPGQGTARLLADYHPVRIRLTADPRVPLGSTGIARIQVPRQSLARRLYDTVWRTFRLPGR